MGAQELTFWIRAPCGHRQRNCGLPSWNSGLRQMNCIVFVIRRRYHRDILRVSKYRYQYLNPISIAYPSCFSSIRVKSLTSHILYAFRAFTTLVHSFTSVTTFTAGNVYDKSMFCMNYIMITSLICSVALLVMQQCLIFFMNYFTYVVQ